MYLQRKITDMSLHAVEILSIWEIARRWHDLRHTWASWLAQKGVPLNDIQEMGAWETAAMVRRYADLSPAHLAHRVQVLDGLIDTNLAQSPNGKSVSS